MQHVYTLQNSHHAVNVLAQIASYVLGVCVAWSIRSDILSVRVLTVLTVYKLFMNVYIHLNIM